MRALLSLAPGGPETLQLQTLPEPEPGEGELRVRVSACAVNFPDLLIIEDKYQLKPARPFSPGCEISAVVEKLGAGVTGWSPGDTLIAVTQSGGMAEQVVLPASSAIRTQHDSDPIEGAGLIFTYATSLHALVDRAALKAGETLLVLGASGGVGLAAVEIGKALGATVVAAVSSADKAEAALAAGADRTIVYGRGPFDKQRSRDLAAQFKAAVDAGGADVIYDPVGGAYAEPALRCIGWEGRYLVVGFAAGIPSLPLNLPLLKSCDIVGVHWGAFIAREPERHAAHVRQLLEWWSSGVIRPRIDRVYSLAHGGEAIARLAERSIIGKVVVSMLEPTNAPAKGTRR
jgi:NADPH2:quinone reductase